MIPEHSRKVKHFLNLLFYMFFVIFKNILASFKQSYFYIAVLSSTILFSNQQLEQF